MTRKSLYDTAVYQECLDRIGAIKPDSQPGWGKMSAAQMFAHCTEVLMVTNGEKELKTSFLARLFKKRIYDAVFNDVPYPRNSRTSPQYIVSDAREFEDEKANLITALTTFHSMSREKALTISHALFGIVPLDERGWGMYKHLDHHLQQFGV